MALAPDGKIYISTTSSTPYLHVINNPDSMGTACDLCQHCINLPALNAFTMPNFPNYALGAEAGSLCDSLTNSISELHKLNSDISIFPNPAGAYATIKYNILTDAALVIYNQVGEVVHFENLLKDSQSALLNLANFKNGIYTCRLIQEGKVDFAQLIIIH